MAVGAICLLGWIGRLGFLANLLSGPVLIGYMNGIAVLMIVSQLGDLTGAPVDGGSVTQQLRSVVTHLHLVHPPTLARGAAVLAMLFVIAWRFRALRVR
jgi:sulfate permease, SulP family